MLNIENNVTTNNVTLVCPICGGDMEKVEWDLNEEDYGYEVNEWSCDCGFGLQIDEIYHYEIKKNVKGIDIMSNLNNTLDESNVYDKVCDGVDVCVKMIDWESGELMFKAELCQDKDVTEKFGEGVALDVRGYWGIKELVEDEEKGIVSESEEWCEIVEWESGEEFVGVKERCEEVGKVIRERMEERGDWDEDEE